MRVSLSASRRQAGIDAVAIVMQEPRCSQQLVTAPVQFQHASVMLAVLVLAGQCQQASVLLAVSAEQFQQATVMLAVSVGHFQQALVMPATLATAPMQMPTYIELCSKSEVLS